MDGFENCNRVLKNQKFKGWDYHSQNEIDKWISLKSEIRNLKKKI